MEPLTRGEMALGQYHLSMIFDLEEQDSNCSIVALK